MYLSPSLAFKNGSTSDLRSDVMWSEWKKKKWWYPHSHFSTWRSELQIKSVGWVLVQSPSEAPTILLLVIILRCLLLSWLINGFTTDLIHNPLVACNMICNNDLKCKVIVDLHHQSSRKNTMNSFQISISGVRWVNMESTIPYFKVIHTNFEVWYAFLNNINNLYLL